ncbi:hypothetical protein ACIBL6_16050 [Streptomyces sp. NPDC050400]|uniref:hypothetical protein n=1 Tax=Streptomyces sp. NPDC050400 TaxID=3365610 RepID=UPI0037A9D445
MRMYGKFMSGLTAVVGTALGTTMLTAAPASATQIAHSCVGEAVVRCANVEMPSTGVFNAHGRVTDTAGGTVYKVMVAGVRLEYYVNGAWEILRQETPYPVYESGQDVARTDTYACGSSARKLVRAKVLVSWENGGSETNDWVTTPSTYICPR